MARQIYKKVNDKLLGARIRAARIEAGYTQVTAAEALNANQSEIAIYESGKRVPKDVTLKKIANKYGVTADWLKYGESSSFDFDDNKEGFLFTLDYRKKDVPHTKKELLKLIEQLNDEDSYDVLYETAKALRIHESEDNFNEWVNETTKEIKHMESKAKDLITIKNINPSEYKKYKDGKSSYLDIVETTKKKLEKELKQDSKK